jgi:hypothetical protein
MDGVVSNTGTFPVYGVTPVLTRLSLGSVRPSWRPTRQQRRVLRAKLDPGDTTGGRRDVTHLRRSRGDDPDPLSSKRTLMTLTTRRAVQPGTLDSESDLGVGQWHVRLADASLPTFDASTRSFISQLGRSQFSQNGDHRSLRWRVFRSCPRQINSGSQHNRNIRRYPTYKIGFKLQDAAIAPYSMRHGNGRHIRTWEWVTLAYTYDVDRGIRDYADGELTGSSTGPYTLTRT